MSTTLQSIINSTLLDDYDSAFLVIDFDRLDSKLDELTSSFSFNTRHAIAIKTNPMASVLEHIASAGYLLEAASYEELVLAEKAGAKASQLVFDSPVKRRWEIDACATHWPGMIVNANTLGELSRFPESCEIRIGLRINPLLQPLVEDRYNVSSPSSKFGVPIHLRQEIIDACLKYSVTGLHMHSGSCMMEPLQNVDSVKNLLKLAVEINTALEIAGESRRINFLDIGGGLSAAVSHAGMSLYGASIAVLPGIDDFEVYTEYGQWIHASAGIAYSQIEYVDGMGKERPQAYLHLGADYFMRDAYTTPREFIYKVYDNQGVFIESSRKISVDLVGPLCFAGDVLSENILLPEMQEGNWLEINETGANTYGLWSRHCSRDIPKIIGFSHERGFFLIRKRRPVIM